MSKISNAMASPESLRPVRRKSFALREFKNMKFPEDTPLLGTVITRGSSGFLTAPRGLGKSILALHIGYAVAAGKRLNPWGQGIGGKVVYLDGEMKANTLKKRLRQIQGGDSHESKRQLADENLHIIGRDAFEHVIGHIDDEEDQKFIESMLPDDCCLLIVDNLSAWTSSAREDGAAFAPIKRWLIRLRTKGIAVLLIHHTGKTGSTQRGTSIHEDLLDYSILLREDKAEKPKNGTSFLLEHTKLRELHEDMPEVCRYTFTTDFKTNVMTHCYEADPGQAFTAEEDSVIGLLKDGWQGKDIATKFPSFNASKVTRLKQRLPRDVQTAIEEAQKRKGRQSLRLYSNPTGSLVMMIALHKNARTTPATRAEMAASSETAATLALRYGVSEGTVYKWKGRDNFHDASHTAHRLQTTLTPAQEQVVVELRKLLLLPLDDLLAVTREFICPQATRSGLDRCLRRHGVGNLNALKPKEPTQPHKAFKSYEPGFIHIDAKYLPQMPDETSRRYLFVAIDRATRWVFVQIKSHKTAAAARSFLNALHKACPIKMQKILTDNGKEFTDRLFASRERQATGKHEFDQLCQALNIEHRLGMLVLRLYS